MTETLAPLPVLEESVDMLARLGIPQNTIQEQALYELRKALKASLDEHEARLQAVVARLDAIQPPQEQ